MLKRMYLKSKMNSTEVFNKFLTICVNSKVIYWETFWVLFLKNAWLGMRKLRQLTIMLRVSLIHKVNVFKFIFDRYNLNLFWL